VPLPVPRAARALLLAGLVVAPSHTLAAQSTADALASWIALAAPPGAEQSAAQALQRELPGWNADRWGNLVRRVGSGTPRRVVACAMDQSAYVVSQVTDDGYLRLRRTGTPRHPLHDQFHEAQRVQVFTAGGTHPGVIAVPNGHFARQHIADSTALTFDDLWVDVGASSRAEIAQLGIALIDPVQLDRPAWAFADHASGPGAGARAGCAAVAAAGDAAATKGVSSGETIFVLSTQRIFGWVGLSTLLAQLPRIDALHLVDEGRDTRAVTSVARAQLPRAFRALESRVTADSVHVFAPAVRFVASAVETVHATEAEALLGWVTRSAAVRGTATFTTLATTGTTRAPASGRDGRLNALANQFMQLADLPGVPGHEQLVRDALLAAMPTWAREQATIDSAGNLVLTMGPDRDAIAFVAHMDEVGFEVDRILPVGQVTLRRLGGAVLSSWEGVPALLHFDPVGTAAPASPLRGVFVPRSAGTTKTPDRLTAWFGHDSAQLVARGVRPGLSITAHKRADRLAGNRVTARGSDDRTGSTALLAALTGIDPKALLRRVYFTWTVREEGGLNGARAFGNSRLPGTTPGGAPRTIGNSLTCVYSIDTFVSSDTPLESPHFAYTPLGAGAVLRSLDDGSLTPRRERDRILALARTAGIPLQVGTTQGSTDGSAIVPWGPPNIGLSWPGRFSHGPAEVLDVRDVDALVRLIRVVALAP
jgi:putative aminopeptidase FrvX